MLIAETDARQIQLRDSAETGPIANAKPTIRTLQASRV
jgi:hypothetical protein